MENDVLQGLRKPQKSIPSKYFYDEQGSRLFEQITELDEYYPTRTELNIMEKNLPEIVTLLGEKAILIELGSGSSRKTRLLLDEIPGLAGYVPVDISEEYLTKVSQTLRKEYPDLLIQPVCADYTNSLMIPDLRDSHRHYVLFYPGSTIGNFRPQKARKFLQNIAKLLNPGEGMLIGVDLVKDKEVIEAAYNDSKGVTAAFNKNLLLRLNRELGADFNPDHFSHSAFFNEKESRIEMHLISDRDQTVRVGEELFNFKEGESIHTENSYKYSLNKFRELVQPWFTVKRVWTDKDDYFSVQYLEKSS